MAAFLKNVLNASFSPQFLDGDVHITVSLYISYLLLSGSKFVPYLASSLALTDSRTKAFGRAT